MKSLDQETVEKIASLKLELLKETLEFYGEDLDKVPEGIYKYKYKPKDIDDANKLELKDWKTNFTNNLIQIFNKQRADSAPDISLAIGGTMAGAAGRNNNPGNITCTSPSQYYGQDGKDGRWPHFKHVVYGIRCWFSYIERKRQKGYDTIRKMWYMYAPPSENNTQQYIAGLGRSTGYNVDAPMPPVQSNKNLFWTLARACFKTECGYVPNDEIMNNAWNMFIQNPSVV